MSSTLRGHAIFSLEVVVLRIVWIIVAVSLLAILRMSPAEAQSGSATDMADPIASTRYEGGSVNYLGAFSSAKDLVPHAGICSVLGLVGRPPVLLSEEVSGVKALPSRCDNVIDKAAGIREFDPEDLLSSPYKITSDSKGRVIVADRGGSPSIHIFDFARRKHSSIEVGPNNRLRSPSGLAVDGQDQLYITDAQLGAILIYDPKGRFRRYIGNRRGERLFEQPSGIAVDLASGHIYVADPPRNLVVMLDADGNILAKLGTRAGGSGPGEFAAPTDVVVRNQELFVLDSQNYRIQVFDLAGNFRASIQPEAMVPSLGFSVDSRGRIYLPGPLDTVRVFQRDGRLLLQFGYRGPHDRVRPPTGIWIDRWNRIYVADTDNHRVKLFEWRITHGTQLPHP